MSIDDDIAFLEQVPALAMLGRPALQIIAIGAENKLIETGVVLFYAGEPADGGYVIQDGMFLLEPEIPDERNLSDVRAGPGTLLGELALLTNTVRPATATALEPSSVIRIPRSLFLKMLEGYPEAAIKLRNVMAARVSQWTHELENVRNVLAPDS